MNFTKGKRYAIPFYVIKETCSVCGSHEPWIPWYWSDGRYYCRLCGNRKMLIALLGRLETRTMDVKKTYPNPDMPWINDSPRDDCEYCRSNYSQCPSICTWCHEKVPCPDTTHRAFGDVVSWAPPDEPVQEWVVSSMHFYKGDKKAASIIHLGDSLETERMFKNKESVEGRKNRYEIVAMDELTFVRRAQE